MSTTKIVRNLSSLSRVIRAAAVLTALGLSFAYGVGVGVYGWPPFSTLKSVQDVLMESRTRNVRDHYLGEKELLQFAFTEPLIQGELVHTAITSLDGIHEANRRMMLPVQRFFDAYDHLRVNGATFLVLDQGATRVLKVTYDLAGTEYDAFAYAVDGAESGDSAGLIIPGSGLNQSSEIYKNAPSNYHLGILEALGPSIQKFILIKPNEDCLAIHDGKSKLNQNFFVNWHLSHGASYSAHYIVNSLAITRYLKSQYVRVVVAGLSQGGNAALLNSLQSQPDVAIVSSGFSVLTERIKGSSHDKIIIPGLFGRYSPDQIRTRMQAMPTRFLFTYGKAENATYKIEAYESLTCEYLAELKNVDCRTHEYGHIFPVEIIRQFLSNHFQLNS